VPTNDRIDELLHLIEAEPEGLRTAEFLQAQGVLETLVGKRVAAASVEETRIVVTTADGARYYFYGFLGTQNSG
jgi:acetyl-CoA carboxylase beta subunit